MQYTPEELSLIWLQYTPAASWKNINRMLQEFGSAEAVFKQFGPDMQKSIGNDGFRDLSRLREKGLDALEADLNAAGAYAVTESSDLYPERLRHIDTPPKLLFVKGNLPDPDKHAVAVIGARHDTRYGRSQAFKIAKKLAAEGVVIVSGLARGIDTAAHRGALEGGGITIGVLGNGIKKVYPPENKDLAEEIIRQGGAVISEYAPDSEPLGFHFPIRNRIISGLSDAVLLIEAQKKSGTASTVNHALDQGKDVFALPGNVDAPGSELPLCLLKEGAQLCTDADDIMDYMHWRRHPEQVSFLSADPENRQDEAADPDDPVLRALRLEEKTFEELLAETGFTVEDLSMRITLLELSGKIERRGGRSYALI